MTMMIPLEKEQMRAMEDVILNEFTAAVTSHDLLAITRCKHFIHPLTSMTYMHASADMNDIETQWCWPMIL